MKKLSENSPSGDFKKILVFAHVPPPLHGQSKMVGLDLAALSEAFPGRVSHVNARWSDSLDEIGGISLRKIGRIFGYIRAAIGARFRGGAEVLYYIPGPVKLSAVIRDFLILSFLRPIFSATIFHWHAIGQGEWAHGSERVQLSSRRWLDSLMRRLAARSLANPELSIVVSPASDRDARAVHSERVAIVANGIDDPVETEESVPVRGGSPKCLLFFSRGTEEKGILDALKAVALAAKTSSGLSLTLAGGVDPAVESEVARLSEICRKSGVAVERQDFVTGREKEELFRIHDLLIFSSHWESFGLVVIEAMAWGLPIVATASDGVIGILGADYPHLAPVRDFEELAKVLAKVLQGEVQNDYGRKMFLDCFQVKLREAALIQAIRSSRRFP